MLKKRWFFSSSSSLVGGGSEIARQPDVADVYTIGKELGTGTFGVVRSAASEFSDVYCFLLSCC
eukprot:SAG31_NODE_4073_length_3614_cov_3.849218_1_plen_64_part_00